MAIATEFTPHAKTAVVTGASSGMGKEFALQLAERPDVEVLWLMARGEQALEEVANQINKPCHCISCDETDMDALMNYQQLLKAHEPNVVYLINCAGFGKFGAWDQVSLESCNSMIDLNCRAVVDMTHMTLPYMHQGSHLIQIASASAFTPVPDMAVYAATKSFVLSYTRAIRWELHGSGINVTAVCPAWVKTGFEKEARDSKGSNTVNHLWFAQKASTVVRRALTENAGNAAVATCGIPAFALRILGKYLPHCITMAGWSILRRL